MRKYLTRKNIAWTTLISLVLVQFIRIDKTFTPVDLTKDFLSTVNAPEDIRAMIKASCYDCHSGQVTYPWYTNVQPVAWWVKGHIKTAKSELNFSNWADYTDKRKDHKLEESAEMILDKEMPLKSYTWMHDEAKLTAEQRQRLADWFSSLRI